MKISVNDLIINRIGRNEIGHASVAMNLFFIFSLLTSNIFIGVVVSTLFGVIKEISDHFEPNNHFSTKDIVWNSMGILCGVLVVVSAYFLV